MRDKTISVRDAKLVAQRLSADGVVVVAFVGGSYQIASYGETKEKCAKLGAWIDVLADNLDNGKMPTPNL